jgi:hypothetical protein
VSDGALGFRRLVLSLSPPAASGAMRLAVEFAELFDADLLGLFVADGGLGHFSAMPFAREFSALGGAWRNVEPARLREDLELAAAAAERRFLQAAGLRPGRRFQIVREPASALSDYARADDVLVLRAPTPADWAVEPQASLLQAAFGSDAAVLLSPTTPPLARGAVVALAARAADPCVAAARAIAEAAGAPLEVMECDASGALVSRDERGARRILASQRRLVVVTRGGLPNEAACRAAMNLGAPLLSLRPRPRAE